MTEAEKRAAYVACDKFLNGHYPVRMNDELSRLAASVGANERADFYGSGDLITEFEKEVASLLGKTAAVFMPSGTMAQVIALRIWCDRRKLPKVGFHATSHLEQHEQMSYRELHGLSAELLGAAGRPLVVDDFTASSGEYAAALVELPQRELGGVLPSWKELKAMSDYCRQRRIAVHLDGARLWEAAPFYQKPHAEICALFDSVYVSFYKGLGGITGAMLCGPQDFIDEAKVWQRRHGGNLFKLYPYILSARESLRSRLPKMKAYCDKTKEIADAIRDLEGLEIKPCTPDTNMFHIYFDRSAEKLEAAFTEIALKQKISGFYRVQPLEDLKRCKAELSVGDAALDLETAQIRKLFSDALAASKPI